ncbi:MAG: SET domain-containing protein [Candidatus Marinamargulisbacteria bacterium]
MIIGPKHSPTNPAQRQRLSRIGKRGTYGLRSHSSESSTQKTIKPEPGTSVLLRNSLGKRLEVVEQRSLEIKNSNEKGRGLYSNVQIKKGTLIGVYGGILLTEDEASTLEGNNNLDAKTNARIQYLFDLETVVQDGHSQLINKDIEKLNKNEQFNKAGEGQYPDVFQTPSKLSFVNHGTKKEQNAKFQSIKIKPIEYRGMRVSEILIMKAIKAIKIGAEIITDYGPEYSKLLREKNIDNQRVLNLEGLFIDRVVEGNIISIKPENKLVGARDLEKDGATAECSAADARNLEEDSANAECSAAAARILEENRANAECSAAAARNLEEDSATAECSAAKILIGMSQGYKDNQEEIGREIAPVQNQLPTTTKKRKRKTTKKYNSKNRKKLSKFVYLDENRNEVPKDTPNCKEVTRHHFLDPRSKRVWIKDKKIVPPKTPGAEIQSLYTFINRMDMVWVDEELNLVPPKTPDATEIQRVSYRQKLNRRLKAAYIFKGKSLVEKQKAEVIRIKKLLKDLTKKKSG